MFNFLFMPTDILSIPIYRLHRFLTVITVITLPYWIPKRDQLLFWILFNVLALSLPVGFLPVGST